MFPKFGIVSKIDYKKGQCKVALRNERGSEDGERFETGWLFVAAARSKGDKAYWMPRKGESVCCFTDEHCEQGVVLCSIFTKEDAPEGDMKEHNAMVLFSDGTIVRYDTSSSTMTITTKGDLKLTVGGDATVKVTGTLSAEAQTMNLKAISAKIEATTCSIEATTANIKASAGKASLLDTLTGMPFHIFTPGA
jgi:phage baseplate assembly protein V